MRLIDADALYERLKADEKLAMDRVIDTPNNFPNGAVNPSAIRYMAQLNERTRLKEIVYDAPTVEQTIFGYPVEHLMLIAEVMRKENVTPENVIEVLTDVGRVASMVRAEFEEQLRKAVERCQTI